MAIRPSISGSEICGDGLAANCRKQFPKNKAASPPTTGWLHLEPMIQSFVNPDAPPAYPAISSAPRTNGWLNAASW